MSTTLLKIIPTDPSLVPAPQLHEQALLLLNNFYKPAPVDLITTDNIEFIDPGSNFDEVHCNYCNELIDIEFWQEAMNNAYEIQFTNLHFVTPCCNKQSSLNNLKYDMPAGFSRFLICVEYPEKELTDEQTRALEVILKTPLRMIWAHY